MSAAFILEYGDAERKGCQEKGAHVSRQEKMRFLDPYVFRCSHALQVNQLKSSFSSVSRLIQKIDNLQLDSHLTYQTAKTKNISFPFTAASYRHQISLYSQPTSPNKQAYVTFWHYWASYNHLC
jgi:hypothetical protein